MNKIFYIANWKMNKTVSECKDFFERFLSSYHSSGNEEIVFCPSFISLSKLDNMKISSNFDNISFGAQNVSHKKTGSYTGEVSVDMLKDTCSAFCIVGHSERRSIYKESDDMINNKIKLLISSNIRPILCIGETWKERQSGISKKI